jgi:hypothetical protein
VSEVIEWHLPMRNLASQGPPRCTSDLDGLERLPVPQQLAYLEKLQRCAAAPWIVGFVATSTARWGPSSRQADVEIFAFVDDYRAPE